MFEVGAVGGEGEGGGSSGVEGVVGIAGVSGDEVAEVFVKEEVIGFEAGFPLVAAVMDGDGGVEVPLFEVVVQIGGDGPGAVVGVEIVRIVAHHAANVHEDVGGENVLIGNDTHRLEIAGGLELGSDARGSSKVWELL